jgi:hypothetical protein
MGFRSRAKEFLKLGRLRRSKDTGETESGQWIRKSSPPAMPSSSTSIDETDPDVTVTAAPVTAAELEAHISNPNAQDGVDVNAASSSPAADDNSPTSPPAAQPAAAATAAAPSGSSTGDSTMVTGGPIFIPMLQVLTPPPIAAVSSRKLRQQLLVEPKTLAAFSVSTGSSGSVFEFHGEGASSRGVGESKSVAEPPLIFAG